MSNQDDTTRSNANPCAEELLDACRELLTTPDLDEALDRVRAVVERASPSA